MTPEQIEALARGMAAAAGGPPWWSYVLILAVGFAGAYLGTYLQEKGKNLATKEDISEITTKVEAAKREQQAILEDLKATMQLRMVAAERRLQAHQEAYSHWHSLVGAVTNSDETPVEQIRTCQEWFRTNCLFLGIRGREAFEAAIQAAMAHHSLVSDRDVNRFFKNWERLVEARNAIAEEVMLPAFVDRIQPPDVPRAG